MRTCMRAFIIPSNAWLLLLLASSASMVRPASHTNDAMPESGDQPATKRKAGSTVTDEGHCSHIAYTYICSHVQKRMHRHRHRYRQLTQALTYNLEKVRTQTRNSAEYKPSSTHLQIAALLHRCSPTRHPPFGPVWRTRHKRHNLPCRNS